jgi:hypothetical protein
MKSSKLLIAFMVLSGSICAQESVPSNAAAVADSTQISTTTVIDSSNRSRTNASSEGRTKTASSQAERKAQYDKYAAMERNGRGLRIGGACLIASSAFWIVGGAIIAANLSNETTTTSDGYGYTTTTTDNSNAITGVAIGAVGGALSIIGGIAMVVTGHIRQHMGENNKKDYSIDFRPTPGGLAMVMDF